MTVWAPGILTGMALLPGAGPAKNVAGTTVLSADGLTLMTGMGTAAAAMVSVAAASSCWMSLIARVTGVPPATLNKPSSTTPLPTASILLTAGARSITGAWGLSDELVDAAELVSVAKRGLWPGASILFTAGFLGFRVM